MIVLDTHALVWWLTEPTKLSKRARQAIRAGVAKGKVSVSAVSIFEIATLLRRGRLELGIEPDRWFAALRSLPELGIEPISADIAWASGMLSATLPGDPADRLITATAEVLRAKLVTADERLRSAVAVETVW